MTRQPNAVDFWRGFALITIFIDHVPGLFYSRYTLVNVSISDAADLFVFLAGWSLRLMADGGGRHMPTRDVMLRLLARALELYAAQVLITMLAIALLAATAIELSNPLLLEWHNAAAVFNDPVPTHIGLAALTLGKRLVEPHRAAARHHHRRRPLPHACRTQRQCVSW